MDLSEARMYAIAQLESDINAMRHEINSLRDKAVHHEYAASHSRMLLDKLLIKRDGMIAKLTEYRGDQ